MNSLPEPILLTIPGPPVPQKRHRIGRNRKTGRPMAYLNKSEPCIAFKHAVALAARSVFRSRPPLAGPIWLEITFDFASKKRGCHDQKPDLDNLEKAVMDALKGIVYEDDAQVARKNSEKAWAISSSTRITIRQLSS
jgi:Holliday junction resolvase RusA-like endonuclease